MAELKQIIALNIADLRHQQNMTQAQLAEALNYTDKAVSKWERGESVPDISVLKELSELFHVTVDYLLQEDHEEVHQKKALWNHRQVQNRIIITGISVVLVWLIATFVYMVLDSLPTPVPYRWLCFVVAVPVSMILWLIFNSIWFNHRRIFLIISLLMWSGLGTIFWILYSFGLHLWLLFALGIPGQLIIVMWSRLKSKQSVIES